MSDLQAPPTEIEISELFSALSPKGGMILRRLAFQRDQQRAELDRLRELLRDIKEWEIGRDIGGTLFVLPTHLRKRIQAAIDEARKG